MAKILEMPKLSPTMEEGLLSAWHKKEGDDVAVDDLLAEVETDKATMEYRSFDKGTLLKRLVPAGATVKLGQPVGIIGAAGEDIAALMAQAAPSSSDAPTAKPAAPAPTRPESAVRDAAPPPETAAPPAQREPALGSVLERTSFAPETPSDAAHARDGRVLASPYVRKVARDAGIDLHGALGTGAGGRVLPADLEAMRAEGSSALVRTAPPTLAQRVPPLEEPEVRALSPMRRAIARRLTESKAKVPHFYLNIDVDAGELSALRARINAELSTQDPGGGDPTHGPLKVSINDLLIKACAIALVRVPECNASFSPDAILIHRRIDISVAVAIPDGLVTPVVRHADLKSVAAIAREMRDLGARARGRKLRPEEMADGTFSISNLGMFGIDEFSAVINPPEGAILAVGQVRNVPVIAEGQIVAGQRLAMTLSCDHRVVDGAIGAAFLAELRRLVEHPLRVLAG